MRKWLSIALLFASLCAPNAYAKDPNTVILLISRENGRNPELMLTQEIGVMVSLLKHAGYRVKVSAPSERDIAGTTTTLRPDLKNSAVRVADYVGFVFPCMAQPTGAVGVAPEFIQLVQKVVATGKPVAAMMSSIDILRKAGVLEGKSVAALNSRPAVVEDGNLVTSMLCPLMAAEMSEKASTSEMMQLFIKRLQGRGK